MIFRALKAVKLLTAIRRERPDLWQQIVEFSQRGERFAELMAEAERDYIEFFEGNIPHEKV